MNNQRLSIGSILVHELFPRQDDDYPDPESSLSYELPLVMVVDDDPMNIAVI